ncbi:hypothetical protein YDYSY3_02390 [Paenibacillus chitinolyticus]|nr:hypothetical protein YDYSY3_02390 [Paenibacillus chitinolyticus]
MHAVTRDKWDKPGRYGMHMLRGHGQDDGEGFLYHEVYKAILPHCTFVCRKIPFCTYYLYKKYLYLCLRLHSRNRKKVSSRKQMAGEWFYIK